MGLNLEKSHKPIATMDPVTTVDINAASKPIRGLAQRACTPCRGLPFQLTVPKPHAPNTPNTVPASTKDTVIPIRMSLKMDRVLIPGVEILMYI